jgi:peptidoglycan/xylan/chitin deacetylase (PgdA/CDA1 family)
MISTSDTRRWLGLAAFVAALALSPSEPRAAGDEAGCKEATTLGVERVVEIDTAGGPLLGNLQYKEIDFLQPGEVVLTFDDGPSPQTTESVLAALAAHCTRATFFMVGRMALAEPQLVRRIDTLGHTVGSHTWSHANQGSLSRASADKEIELGVSAVTAALGKPIAPFFRFPYLSDPKASIRHLEGRNLGIFSIDVDSYDFRTRNGAVMKQNVLSQLQSKGKGIILFHDIQRSTAAGLGDLLDELKRRKFKVVHMVPKATAATLAEYDAIAAKDIARRSALVAAKPLSTRSMVWPVAGGDAKVSATVTRPEGPAALPWKAPGSAKAVKGAANAAAQPAAAGAPLQQTGTIAPPPAVAPRPSWKREELPWQEQMWGHYR